jgi:hypothetical protein
MLNNFFTIGFRAKNSIYRVLEIIPKELKNVFKFDLNFKVKASQFVDLTQKNVCKSVPVVSIKFIFIINDHCNTY